MTSWHLSRAGIAQALIWLMLSAPAVADRAIADEASGAPLPAADTQPPATGPNVPAPNPEPEDDPRKRAAAWGMSYLLLGIVLLGMLLLVMVMVWGRRVRGMARKPYPAQHRGDEFWYLRKGPPDAQPPGGSKTDAPPKTPDAPGETPPP